MKKSKHDKLRDNQTAAKGGGPGYRASEYGKGDVSRQRGAGLTKYRLGLDLIEIADTKGQESPEYKAALKAWKNAQI